MTQAKPKLATFADYLAFDDGLDSRCELTYEALIELPPESDEHALISRVLIAPSQRLSGFGECAPSTNGAAFPNIGLLTLKDSASRCCPWWMEPTQNRALLPTRWLCRQPFPTGR